MLPPVNIAARAGETDRRPSKKCGVYARNLGGLGSRRWRCPHQKSGHRHRISLTRLLRRVLACGLGRIWCAETEEAVCLEEGHIFLAPAPVPQHVARQDVVGPSGEMVTWLPGVPVILRKALDIMTRGKGGVADQPVILVG